MSEVTRSTKPFDVKIGNPRAGRKDVNPHITLDLTGLDAFGQLVSLYHGSRAAALSGRQGEITVNPLELRPEISSNLTDNVLCQWLPRIRFSTAKEEPDERAEFVYLTDVAQMSRKLMGTFSSFYVIQRVSPSTLDPQIWASKSRTAFVRELEDLIEEIGGRTLKKELDNYQAGLRVASPRVTLISSIYDGDIYLDHFFSNVAAMQGYDACEHLLIRAGSRGNEHLAIMEHVKRHANAVYINLNEDPGLYEVWNLGARVATSPYLSSANVDDRRAPEHLESVMGYLDSNPAIDVASTALRVTETPNLAWSESINCPVWYDKEHTSQYDMQGLFKSVAADFVSHNIPHCMPVWRRELHAFHGYFREKEFGPSADWEFWLRVGQKGHQFYVHDQPLGLHLRNPQSYWRTAGSGIDFDARITKKYVSGTGNWGIQARPASLDIAELTTLYSAHAHLEVVGRCYVLAEDSNTMSGFTLEAINKAAELYVGVPSLSAWTLYPAWYKQNKPRNSNDITEFIVECLHDNAWIANRRSPENIAARVLNGALIDLQMLGDDQFALVTRALLHRRLGQPPVEREFLREAHCTDRKGFWHHLQRVYRFECPLEQILEVVDDPVRPQPQLADPPEQFNIIYYPDFTRGNPYQTELYKHLKESGAHVAPVNSLAELAALNVEPGKTNIVHLHWINALFKGIRSETFNRQAEIFKTILKRLKQKGFQIYWTVHNNLNHETVGAEQERQFRRELAELVDRIYLHHPLASEYLDWLPEGQQLYLCEHGRYPVPGLGKVSRAKARNSLGISEDELLLAYTGRINDYKGLDEYLPGLLELIRAEPSLRLRIMGRIASQKVKDALAGLNEPRVIVENRFVPDEELDQLFVAADAGLLTYKNILTSGLLFHMLSAGLPVLAPNKGTIPAYVINGWNGFTYESEDELTVAIKALISCRQKELEYMRENALKTARQLDWKFMTRTRPGEPSTS